MTTSKNQLGPTSRITTRLRDGDDWKQLLGGAVDAIHLRVVANHRECKELLDFMLQHPRTEEYSTAAGIHRLGTSFSDIRREAKGDLEKLAKEATKRCSEPDILQEALGVNAVVSHIIGRIAASWPYGLETFSYQGVALHRLIARRIVGGSAEPHDDDIAKELPKDLVASSVRIQLGVNLYIEIPREGGELEGWHRRLTRDEYDALRNEDPKLSYGIRRDLIGRPNWVVKPSAGDIVIFNNNELHAICKSNGARTTWGFFLGYRGDNKPLMIWS